MEVRAGYKHTDVGVIPEDWQVTSIGQFAPLQRGFDLPTSQIKEGNYPVVYSNGVMNYHDTAMARGPGVVTGRSGTLGKVNFIETDFWPHNTTLWVTRFNGNVPRYVFYLYAAIGFERFASGSGVPTLNRNDAHAFRIAFPPSKREQESIAGALGDADTLIESMEQLLSKTRQQQQGALQELLRPRPTDEVRPLGEVSSLKGRIGWQGLKQTEFTTNEGEPFLITGMNFKDGAIRWDEVYHISEARFAMAPEIQLRADDVLMTKDGTIGKVLYIDKIPYPGKASLNSHLLLFRPIGASYHPKYLYYQLGSRGFKDFVELSKSGTTFWGLSQAAVAAYPLVRPPLEDQVRIAAILSDMDAQVGGLEVKLSKARQIKQGMMQELLTGKIRLA